MVLKDDAPVQKWPKKRSNQNNCGIVKSENKSAVKNTESFPAIIIMSQLIGITSRTFILAAIPEFKNHSKHPL